VTRALAAFVEATAARAVEADGEGGDVGVVAMAATASRSRWRGTGYVTGAQPLRLPLRRYVTGAQPQRDAAAVRGTCLRLALAEAMAARGEGGPAARVCCLRWGESGCLRLGLRPL
jgi:hypothetical protein